MDSICHQGSDVADEPQLLDIPSPRTENSDRGVRYIFAPDVHYSVIFNNLTTMLHKKTSTDVTLVSKEGERFPFHSVLLAAAGTEFHKIFCSTVMQFFKGELVVNKTPSDVLKALTTYVYEPGKLFSHPDDWNELMNFAADFGIEHMVDSAGNITQMIKVLQDMYEQHLMTFTLVRAGKEEMWAHTAILIASSPVFKSWMVPDYLPKREDVVNIENISAEVVHVLLEYVYTAYIDIDMDIVEKLLYGSCELIYPSAAKSCVDFLISNTTAKNVVWILNLAQEASQIRSDQFCVELWDSANTFIKDNLQDVLNDGRFEDIRTKNEVIEIIACANLDNVDLKSLVQGVVNWCNSDADARLSQALQVFACISMLTDGPGLALATRLMGNYRDTGHIRDALFPVEEDGSIQSETSTSTKSDDTTSECSVPNLSIDSKTETSP